MKRREWIRKMGGLGLMVSGGGLGLSALAGAATAGSRARLDRNRLGSRVGADPQGTDPHFLVFAHLVGAWDVCLAMDPKDRNEQMPDGSGPAFDQPYDFHALRESNGILFGPAMEPLWPYASRMAVVNGIQMLVESHSERAVWNAATTFSDTAPYVQAMIATSHPQVSSCPFPHLYVGRLGSFVDGPLRSGTVEGDVPSFVASVDPQVNGIPSEKLVTVAEKHLDSLSGDLERQTYSNYLSSLDRMVIAEAMLTRALSQVPDDLSTRMNQGVAVGSLFASGALGSVSLNDLGQFNLDTHSDHYETHQLDQALAAIAEFLEGLSRVELLAQTGRSVMDCVTVVITSEFSRTPRLNSINGKDHNLRTNSAILLGKNVRPGVYGRSGSNRDASGQFTSHVGLPLDLSTGRPKEDGNVLLPATFWRTTQRVLGANMDRWLPAGPTGNFL